VIHDEPIGIAGTGRIAKALGALLSPVSVIAGRSSLRDLPRQSRRIIIAVADDAISQVASELLAGGLEEGIVLHVSAAAGPDALAVLRGGGNSVGVLHPLQTVPSAERGIETLRGATFAFAGDPYARAWALDLIGRLGGKPLPVDPSRWAYYHAAAVMACNYHVTLVDAALELAELAGIAREAALDALAPLIRATTDNILTSGPEQALTGPIRRGDAGTIRRHLEALKDSLPETKELYNAAGLRTIAIAQRAGLPREAANKIAAALTQPNE
jgi:predicted short-subunit dehydrogenase-like oxidoreductase (DUF2520 family)